MQAIANSEPVRCVSSLKSQIGSAVLLASLESGYYCFTFLNKYFYLPKENKREWKETIPTPNGTREKPNTYCFVTINK